MKKYIERLEAALKPVKQVAKAKPTRIKYKGEFIAIHNGKTLWQQPGHAKSATRNFIDICAGEILRDDGNFNGNYKKVRAKIEEIRVEFMKNVEFVEL